MEGARGDEQDVVGLAPARTWCETVVPSISGSRSRCTPSRETSPPTPPSRAGDLVDLVDEDDAVVLDEVDGVAGQRLLVEQLVGLLGHQQRVASLTLTLAA